jgi:hypothetical protein
VKLTVTKTALALAGILAAPLTLQLEHRISTSGPSLAQVDTQGTPSHDPRVVRLRGFLSKLRCPVKDLSEEFVHAADDNDLDWRLLPSISLIESSGGKAYKNNNIFGWNNGDHTFPTIRAGLHQVAFVLGRSLLYRNRTTDQKLHIYNPSCDYPARVEDVMNRISPVPIAVVAQFLRPGTNSELGSVAQN